MLNPRQRCIRQARAGVAVRGRGEEREGPLEKIAFVSSRRCPTLRNSHMISGTGSIEGANLCYRSVKSRASRQLIRIVETGLIWRMASFALLYKKLIYIKDTSYCIHAKFKFIPPVYLRLIGKHHVQKKKCAVMLIATAVMQR